VLADHEFDNNTDFSTPATCTTERAFVMSFLETLSKVKAVLQARWSLRKCNKVGSLSQVMGRTMINNKGSMILGDRVRLRGVQVPVELATGSGASLTIGDNCSINNGTSICALESIKIGNFVGIGPYCLIADTDFHVVGDYTMTQKAETRPVVIEDKVWIASRCIILKGVTIGEGAVVTAGAVVSQDVAPYTVVGGVPARVIRTEQKERQADNTGNKITSRNESPARTGNLASVDNPISIGNETISLNNNLNNTLEPRVKEIISNIFSTPLENVTLDSSPETIESWESMGHLMLMMELEQEFKTQISPEDSEKLKNVRSIVTLLEKRCP